MRTALSRLEEALIAAGAPSAARLRPGLSDPAMTARLATRGLDLVALYQWHDGIEPVHDRLSEQTHLCYLMPGLYFTGLWWMPAGLSERNHLLHRLGSDEWLLVDGVYEYVTYSRTHEVIAWNIEDGLQTRFPTLESYVDFAAEAWEVGVFYWESDAAEDSGGFVECDRRRLEVLLSIRPDVLRMSP